MAASGSGGAAAFGFVVDDDGADKRAAGGAAEFAAALADRPAPDPTHVERCVPCAVAGEAYACVGLVPAPIPADVERWLVERLPADLDGLRGFLLKKAIGDYGYTGEGARELRARGLLAAPLPFTRHFGPFFRRFPVSSEHLLEEMLCAGDVDPAHGLAILVHLGAVEIDARVPGALSDGEALSEVVADPASRRARTRFALATDPAAPVAPLARYLRALHAAFVADAPVRVLTPAG